MTGLLADWESHHIEGYANAALERGEAAYFRTGLMSHITGNLYVGGCIDGVRLPDDFAWVVSLYPWEKYQLGPETHRLEVQMYDAGEVPDEETLHETARMVNRYLDVGKTLVHCQAGLNRSNLVAGLALVQQGLAPVEAISLLREKRSPMVLCNRVFEEWLLEQGVE